MELLNAVKPAIDTQDIDAFGEALRKIQDRKSLVPLFNKILLDEWHEAHEDIVFELGLISDPSSIDTIEKAIIIPFKHLVKWNNLHEFQRKCAYALARIGTKDSHASLEKLSKNADPYISKYGKEGLQKWPLKKQ